MKKLLIIALAFVSLAAFAQQEKEQKEIKQEVKIENIDGKYTITLNTTENGKEKSVTKTFDSLEDLKNDPDFANVKIMNFDNKGDHTFFFNNDGDEDGENIAVFIGKDGDEGLHEDHKFIFKSGEGSDTHNIKVWIDEDGEKHISKDGEEINDNTWTDEDGKTYDIHKMDGKVMFKSENSVGEFITEDDDRFDINISHDNDHSVDGDVIIIEKIDENSDGANREIHRIVHQIKIHLEEVEENEFSEMPGIDAKVLKVNELSYYPNPNNGKFTLAFQADDKPTEIRITGIDGKEVYSELLQSFEGSYNKEIDLSGKKQGIYLLQILQGKKAVNKKIVIE